VLKTYVAKQCQLLHVALKITLPQKYCGDVFRSLMCLGRYCTACLGRRCTACLGRRYTACLGRRCTACLGHRCTSCLGRRCTSCLGCRYTSCLGPSCQPSQSRHALHQPAILAAPSCLRAPSWWQHESAVQGIITSESVLSQDGHLPWNKGSKRVQFQWICTGLVNSRGQRLGEHQRRTTGWARHSKDTANDHLVQTCLYSQSMRQLSLAVWTS